MYQPQSGAMYGSKYEIDSFFETENECKNHNAKMKKHKGSILISWTLTTKAVPLYTNRSVRGNPLNKNLSYYAFDSAHAKAQDAGIDKKEREGEENIILHSSNYCLECITIKCWIDF